MCVNMNKHMTFSYLIKHFYLDVKIDTDMPLK